ncbi:TetR/AcrR family transcriptional regulator [Nocardia transvalensis]|uniref:TetR/AcrR family transcriptional regulator n=1 Tax=Nocardia transvalensis TaxID=37333 RepID=UPI001894382F|nr:TetR/AcrR family transcriptional regulator [Nocardia transvalensis]MBF6332964.1 TetR/AcrR family transcriptional regulator [Nocardia transvalensis]
MARTKSFDPDDAVAKAMEVFWRKGYGRTTPQNLVDAIGIGRGSLYNAFAGKRDLFERALRRYQAQETVRLIDLLDGPGSPRERVRAALTMVLDAACADTERRGCLATNTAVELGGDDETVDLLVRRIFDRQHDAFRGAIEEGQRAGEFGRDLDPQAAATFLLATINGMRVLAKADPRPARLAGLVETAMRAL